MCSHIKVRWFDSNKWNTPGRDILIEGLSAIKHLFHVSNSAYIPSRYILIKSFCIIKHSLHGSNPTYIPIRNILVKGVITRKHRTHVCKPCCHNTICRVGIGCDFCLHISFTARHIPCTFIPCIFLPSDSTVGSFDGHIISIEIERITQGLPLRIVCRIRIWYGCRSIYLFSSRVLCIPTREGVSRTSWIGW